MEVKIKQGKEMIDATIDMVDGVMVVSPKEVKFEPNIEGWTEITPDNVDSIYDKVIKRVIVTDGNEYKPVLDWHCGLSTMAKCGGYYYYILPELKIE